MTDSLDMTRAHDDPLAAALPPLALDRQRIVHSAAFRRLLQKTQVFIALESDHFRTRMTHTLEVAHFARCLAERLNRNANLAEVIALAHDLGHPPFGHAGEVALNACLAPSGSFEHNQHTLRIVEELEHPYPQFHGLNLTRVVRKCLATHRTQFDKPGEHPLQDGTPPPLEGLIVALADRVSYALHDLQDGLYAGLFAPALLAEVELFRDAYEGPSLGAGDAYRGHLRSAIDTIATRLMDDVAANARDADKTAIRLSPDIETQLAQLDQFLLNHVYRSQRLVRADTKARRIVTAIFEAYTTEPRLMPQRYAQRVDAQGLPRVVTDYIAGMTDRFCLQEHARLFDPNVDA